MLALQIADIRLFMKKFLLEQTFDHFLLLEGSITTFSTFRIDGTLHREYYSSEEQERLQGRKRACWKEVRPFCLELIKGRRTPLAFQITLQLSEANTERFLQQIGEPLPPEQVRGLLLNLRYDGQQLQCTTGTSLSVFSPDKRVDHAWDDMIQKFFSQQQIPFESL